jgi:phosphatidylglycerophosphate synthase
MTIVHERPTAADFLAQHRGGGLFTETVNQRVGARMALCAHRIGLAPTVLTLGNLALGLTGSVLAIAGASRMNSLLGGAALVLWQVAYSLDCADGQLARVTGRAGPLGGRVDILCDVAIQISLVACVVAVTAAYRPDLPQWLAATFAGSWMVNLVTSVLHQGSAARSLLTSVSTGVRVLKLVRDYGAMITVLGLTLTFEPQWMIWLLVLFTAINAAFLLVSIAATARESLHRG